MKRRWVVGARKHHFRSHYHELNPPLLDVGRGLNVKGVGSVGCHKGHVHLTNLTNLKRDWLTPPYWLKVWWWLALLTVFIGWKLLYFDRDDIQIILTDDTSAKGYWKSLNLCHVNKYTLVWWQLWNFIVRHVEFNRFLHTNEHPERIFW